MFNSGKSLGDLNDNLTLQTKGKVYIQYGKKFIDLLNDKGELNVTFPSEINKLISITKSMKSGDILVYNGKNFESYNVNNKFDEVNQGISNARRSSGMEYSLNELISVDYSNLYFQSTGGIEELTINNDYGKTLSIKSISDNWINARLIGNTLTISTQENPGQKRTGTVTIQTNTLDELTIKVEQEKVYISGTKGLILISFDYIDSDNVTNNHLFLTGYKGLKFTLFCKKIGPDGLVPGDMSIKKAPYFYYEKTGLYYFHGDADTLGDNYIYEFEVTEQLPDNTVFNIISEYNENYNQSNLIVAEYSEERATICYVKIGRENGEEKVCTLKFPLIPNTSSGMEDVSHIGWDYNSHDGYYTFECFKKNNGLSISVTNLELYYMHHFGVGAGRLDIRWYNIHTETINGKYGIRYHIDENPYPDWRCLTLGCSVTFSDGNLYEFSVDVNLFPIVYLNCGGTATAPTNNVCTVKCDGTSANNPYIEHSELLHYYATKYSNPINSPWKLDDNYSTSSTNFIEDSLGKVVFHFEDSSLIESITELNLPGWIFIDLKRNNTNQQIKVYPYVDYVDSGENIITSTKLMDKSERDRILQDTCH